MPATRAIDKLRQAFSVEERNSYAIFKGEELILKIFWSPLTIADRDTINSTLIAMNKGKEEGSLDFALQVIVTKAEDEAGAKMFTASALHRTNLLICAPSRSIHPLISNDGVVVLLRLLFD